MTIPDMHAGTRLVAGQEMMSLANPEDYSIAGVPDRDVDFQRWYFGTERSPAYHIDRNGYNVRVVVPAMIRPGAAVLPRPSTGGVTFESDIVNDDTYPDRTFVVFFTSQASGGTGYILGNTRVSTGGFAFLENWAPVKKRLYWQILYGGGLSAALDNEYVPNTPIAMAVIARGNSLTMVMNGQEVETITTTTPYVAKPGRLRTGTVDTGIFNWKGAFYRFMFWKRAIEVEQAKELTLSWNRNQLRVVG